MTYACLGPEGTFTQAALRRMPTLAPDMPHRPFPTVRAALEAVRRGDCGAAVVPLENSVKGVVPATMDRLVSARLHINAEVTMPVTFALMAPAGSARERITRVLSHPHALGQCRTWLARHLPDAYAVPADSTAAAAREVADAGAEGVAAIAAPLAAELYGLEILATDIGEHASAVTRFVAVSQGWLPPARAGRERTSLVVSLRGEGPGQLVSVLTEFSSRGIELSWIQSWPTGDRLGNYRFFIDIDGHIENPSVREAIAALAGLGARARFMGSYPRWATAAIAGPRPQAVGVAA
ncbi:prephenate dehydratase [Streptomyces sp.]|uniref:prephenate dehydratase n=1 Tax=Streptomyces sp. TaxID=1931 RepID=UPI002F419DDD